MTVSRLHHINFVVRDLEAAIHRFENELRLPPFQTVDHAPRGSHIARSRVGETYVVLVCPYDPASVPGRFLDEHGEGFFLLSFGVDDLEDSLRAIDERDQGPVRQGILDWRVADVGSWFGANLQLTANPRQ
ncbi:MAG: VOC family protein [Pseudomonadota bacterium]